MNIPPSSKCCPGCILNVLPGGPRSATIFKGKSKTFSIFALSLNNKFDYIVFNSDYNLIFHT